MAWFDTLSLSECRRAGLPQRMVCEYGCEHGCCTQVMWVGGTSVLCLFKATTKLTCFFTASGSIPTFLRACFCWSQLTWLQIHLWKHPCSCTCTVCQYSTQMRWAYQARYVSVFGEQKPRRLDWFKSAIKFFALLRRAPREGGWEFRNTADVKNMVERMGVWEKQQYLVIGAS